MIATEPARVLELEPAPLPAAVARRRWTTEGVVVFASSLVLYVVVGALLVFRYDSVLGDALSRVGNAYYVLYSRDPKLAAVGFVWTPLPSLLMAPFLPLKALWAPLVTRGFLANIESAVLMAGAAVLLRGTLADLAVPRAPRLALVTVFVLNPMTLYYGANGMSEAMLLFFLLAAVRPLARWMRQPEPRHLVLAGIALGLGYLGRYEAFAAGMVAAATVVAVSYARGRHEARGHRGARDLAIADGMLVGVPVVITFGLWALASWLIVGHPFDTFASRYGNTAQVSASASGIRSVVGGTGLDALPYLGRQTLAVAPALALVLVVAAVLAWRRRDPWIMAPIALLGGVMAFQIVTVASGGSFGWLRFQITAIPLTALLVGYGLAPAWGRASLRAAPLPSRRRRRWQLTVATVVALALTGLGTITVLRAFRDPLLAREEYSHLVPIADRIEGKQPWQRLTLGDLDGERRVAAYVDRLRPGSSSVLVDVALGFPIVLASQRPHQFVITPDRDFPDAIADPVGAHIRYILVGRDAGSMDAVTAAYPNIYKSGAGFARLVKEFRPPHGNGRAWRLFRVEAANDRNRGSQ